LQKYYRKEL